MDDVSKALRDARALIANPENWTQGGMARNAEGELVGARDLDAKRFCAWGAVLKVTPPSEASEQVLSDLVISRLDTAARRVLLEADRAPATVCSVPQVNDDLDHAAVLRMFDYAIPAAA